MRPQLLDPRPYFANLPDPRHETRNKLHKLHDILLIVTLGKNQQKGKNRHGKQAIG